MGREKPFAHNAAVDRMRRQQLDDASFDRYAGAGRALTWPTVMYDSGGLAAPVPDASSSVRYVRHNGIVSVWFFLFFSGTSTFGGGNSWQLDIPGVADTPLAGDWVKGGWEAYDSSAAPNGYIFGSVSALVTSGHTVASFLYRATAGVGAVTRISTTNPWTWATGDALTGFLVYEARDGFSP